MVWDRQHIEPCILLTLSFVLAPFSAPSHKETPILELFKIAHLAAAWADQVSQILVGASEAVPAHDIMVRDIRHTQPLHVTGYWS